MSVFTTEKSSPTPDLQSPFLGFAGLASDEGVIGERAQAPNVTLDSPFGTGLQAETADTSESLLAELLENLADDEFEDALAQLVDEAAATHLQGEMSWSGSEGTGGGMQGWFESLADQTDRLLDGVAARLEHEDLAAMPARDLDALLESFSVEPSGSGEVAFEQFLGGLLKKAGNLVKGVVNVAKKGIAAVSKVLPIGGLLNKLKALVRPLLTNVLKAAMNRLPASVRPIARKVAAQLGISGEVQPIAAGLAEAFDRDVAQLMVAADESAADGVLAEAAAESAESAPDVIGGLDAARKELGRQLTELPAGSYPKPEIQQFLPAVMAALPIIKIGISIIGRQRVVDFIAERIADLLRSMIGAESAKMIARPIVDTGLSLIGLEVPAEAEADIAGEALASTVEATARRALTLPPAVQDDRLLLDAAVQQYFAEAAAAHLPGQLLRADLPERETQGEGGVWVMMPRVAAPRYRFLKYTRPFEVRVSRQVARAVPWSDGGTLEAHLLDRGVRQWPVTAEAHLYETLLGGHLGHLRYDDSLRGLAEMEGGGMDEVEALTPEIAGLLLGEPALGRAVPSGVPMGRGGPSRLAAKAGSRFLRLKLRDRRGLHARGPRARVVVRADLGVTPPRLTVELRLSELQAQEMLDLLTRTQGPDLPSAVRKVQQIHEPTLKPRLVACLTAHSSLGLDDAGAQAAAEQLITGVNAGLSSLFQHQSTELAAAVRNPAQGIRITLTFSGITREALKGTPPPPTAAVAPGLSHG